MDEKITIIADFTQTDVAAALLCLGEEVERHGLQVNSELLVNKEGTEKNGFWDYSLRYLHFSRSPSRTW